MQLSRSSALLACLFVVACGKQAEPVADTGAVADSAGTAATPNVVAPAWDASSPPVAGATLSVMPNPVDFCTDKLQVVDVSWDVTAAKVPTVEIWVEETGGKQKVWVATRELQGGKATGKWVREGMKLIAIDPAQKRVLNSVMVGAAPCTGA